VFLIAGQGVAHVERSKCRWNFGLNMASLGGGTNQLTLSVVVSNAATFSVTYKNSLTNAAWESLGTYSKTGAVTVITDTNSVPQRFYKVVTP